MNEYEEWETEYEEYLQQDSSDWTRDYPEYIYNPQNEY